jgi:hypothetical protein
VVLDHHLLYGRRMTLITFQDGKPVLRDGKVGTEQECCCCDPNCLTLSSVLDLSTGAGGCRNVADQVEAQINDEWDFNVLLMQTMADNLSAIGWSASVEIVKRIVDRQDIECPPEVTGCPDNQCYTIEAELLVRLTATCSCCIGVPSLSPQNCLYGLPATQVPCEFFGQPDGVWALITPTAVIPEGEIPYIPKVLFGPTCAPWHPMWAPYGINGEYGDFDPGNGGGIWVPVCTDSEWCENPLP